MSVLLATSPGVLGAAYSLGGILAALTGVATWRLSKRAQDTATERQAAADQGPYVSSLQAWSQDIVATYRMRAQEIQDECDRALAACQARVTALEGELASARREGRGKRP